VGLTHGREQAYFHFLYLDIPRTGLPRALRGRSDHKINELRGTVSEQEAVLVGLPMLGPDPLGQGRLCGLLVGGGVVVAGGNLDDSVKQRRYDRNQDQSLLNVKREG